MITLLGYGDRDYRLFTIWKNHSKYPWRFIDYRLHWVIPSNFSGRLSFEMNGSDFICLKSALYKSYLSSFKRRLENTRIIILPGKHRIWEKAAYEVALELNLNIIFYEAADRKHIYLSRFGVCGDAQFISKYTRESSDDMLITNSLQPRFGLWFFGLLKFDSGEFWKAVFQRLKRKTTIQSVDIKNISFKENSLLVLGQVPRDLNSVVYGLSRDEFIEEIKRLVYTNKIEYIYYKPHPLFYDVELQSALCTILNRDVVVVSGGLSQKLNNVKICVANNSNGLLEVKLNNFEVECIALGRFMYSDLFEIFRDNVGEELNKIVSEYLARNLLRCDYRDGPSYIEHASLKIIEKEYENSCNWS